MQKKRPDVDARTPTDIDTTVGARVRAARLESGISQADLANAVGVTFQQIQKYETGRNRLTASRLQLIAKALNKPMAFFLPHEDEPEDANSLYEIFQVKGVAEIGRALASIESPRVRRRLVSLMLTMVREFSASAKDTGDRR